MPETDCVLNERMDFVNRVGLGCHVSFNKY
jgi:hypothetical protein